MVKLFPSHNMEVVKVFPWHSTQWSVELYPDEQPFLFPTKGQALSFALAWADYHQPCEVRVLDGTGDVLRSIHVPSAEYRRAAVSDRRRVQIDIPFPDRRQHERRG